MNRVKIFIHRIFLVSFVLTLVCGCIKQEKTDLIKVLIISGKNNHEWKKTTPLLVKIYKDSRLFNTTITEKPDTLTYNELKKFDVVVSNWNSWPDNDFRMTREWENDFLRFIREGGGVVSIHAGASSFYSWDEYHRIGIGRWGKETNHGKPARAKISGFDQANPITTGLRDFYIVDEIWEKTDIFPDAIPLASVSATNGNDGHLISESAVFVNQIEKGRCFYTTLGHDERAFLNTGFQTILLRATQWAASRNVTTGTPSDLKELSSSHGTDFTWKQSDTTLCLMSSSVIIWQYNFNNRFGKTYFHPVSVRNSTLTCASPPDHPWHNGLWFSWKYINGVNYWEYLDDFKSEESGYKSEGKTHLQKIDIVRNTDFSADIRMDFLYHPDGSDAVMSEKRDIHISPPLGDGSYYIDHENIFIPLIDKVILDRTPVEGEPEGKSWGGYAGLSIRFNQDLTSPEIIVPDEKGNFRKNNWLYMGFNTLTGDTAGICILQNLKFTTTETSWYVINNPDIPFFYYSPAALFDGRIVLKKGDSLHLKYRVWILPGLCTREKLQEKFNNYVQ